MVLRTLLFSAAAVGLAASALGQAFPQPGQPRRRIVQLVPVTVKGKVLSVRPGMIAVTTPADELWMVNLSQNTREVRITGKAEPDVLRPGMFVRLTAPVDKRYSRVEGQVRGLTIITPSQQSGRMLGVFFPGQEGGGGAVQPPGGAPQQADPPPVGDSEDANSHVQTFDVRGRLVGIKARRVTLYVPNHYFKPRLTFELAEEPVIDLDVSDYSVVRPGDTLSAMGIEMGDRGIEALELSIELVEPLSTGRKKPTRPATRRPSRTREPPARPGERQAFEVAKEMEQEGAESSEPEDEPAAGRPAERAVQIVELLKLDPEDLEGKTPLTISLNGVAPETFTPSKPLPGKSLRDRFGPPEQTGQMSGTIQAGEGGQPIEVRWELWVFGRAKVIVDENGAARYYSLVPP